MYCVWVKGIERTEKSLVCLCAVPRGRAVGLHVIQEPGAAAALSGNAAVGQQA